MRAYRKRPHRRRSGTEPLADALGDVLYRIEDATERLAETYDAGALPRDEAEDMDGRLQDAYSTISELIGRLRAEHVGPGGAEVLPALSRNVKRHRPRGGARRPASGGSARKAMAAVKAWLDANDLDMDTSLRTPAEHRRMGYDVPREAAFVIVSEGPFYMLMNGYYDTPAAYELQEQFIELLKNHGLWYDQGDHITFYVMPASAS